MVKCTKKDVNKLKIEKVMKIINLRKINTLNNEIRKIINYIPTCIYYIRIIINYLYIIYRSIHPFQINYFDD